MSEESYTPHSTQITDIEELELYNKYKDIIPRQKRVLLQIDDILQDAGSILIDIEQGLKDDNLTQEEYESSQKYIKKTIEEATEDRHEQEQLLRHCEEFISAYEEKQQRESDQSFKN